MSIYTIYGIKSKDKPIFYIGSTKAKAARLSSHKAIYGKGISFVIIRELECTKKEARELEAHEIKEYKRKGGILLNQRAAGSGKILIQSRLRQESFIFVKGKMKEYDSNLSETIDILLYELATS